jgi:uncharacterized protein YdeI (YjbR/CyaY-like superfamily)
MTRPVVFRSPAGFRSWLRSNHANASELVVSIRKAGVAAPGITYAEALDEALCYGWIDGVRRRIDDESFSIRFSPRKPKSIWSRINVAHMKRLIAAGRMQQAGMAAWEAREEKRTGVYAFEQESPELPAMYARQFRANPEAWQWFRSQAPWYQRLCAHRVISAKKEETRQRRLADLIARSARGERIR